MSGPDLGVIGAGVFGAATADAAARRGWRVTLYEAHEPPADGASSHDVSKVIRATYGAATARYGPLTLESLAAWETLQREARVQRGAGQALLHRTGVVLMGDRLDPGTFLGDSLTGMAALGKPVSALTAAEGRRRWPGLGWDGVEVAVVDDDGGWLAATACVRALVARAVAHGATLRAHSPVRGIDEDASGVTLRLDAGPVRHDRVVVAAGPWVKRLLPAAPATPTRQHVLWLRPPDARPFAAPRLPVWIDDLAGAGWYGFPAHPAGLVKLGHHAWTDEVDADVDRTPDPAWLAHAVAAARRRLPELPPDCPAEARTCLYTNSPAGDVVVAAVPGAANVVLAGLGSGHGFKLGPAVGRLAVEAALGAPPTLPWPGVGVRAVW